MVIRGKHVAQWKAGETPASDLVCSESGLNHGRFEQGFVLRRDEALFMRSWLAGARKDTGHENSFYHW